jgi:deoxyribodipyrimidine photo-lyase
VTIATQKQEVGARTLRPKILRVLGRYIEDTVQVQKHPIGWPGTFKKMAELTTQISDVLDSLNSNQTHILVESGESAARRALDDFIAYRLPGYAQNRNDPSQNGTSGLSPYLHFGQLWSGEVVQKAYQALQSNPLLQPDVDALVEELVVRKELSENFCYYQPRYDEIAGAPLWAQNTLLKHQTDLRSYLYSLEEFEQAKTHDPAWNAAQTQLTKTGCMHGYMRMYWAKKVLEWSESPKRALVTLTYLNDFYSLDGGDPNGYTGILWSIAGLHDRPWGERAIYGTVRCMVYDGLRRKFAIEEYIQAWQ